MSIKNVKYVYSNKNINNENLMKNLIKIKSKKIKKSPIKTKVSFHSIDTIDTTNFNTQENSEINSPNKLFTFPRNLYKFWIKKDKKKVKFKDFQSNFKESLVEYIEVKSYKNYNKNSFIKENQKVDTSCSCMIF
jgi:hypothetical protein